METATRNGLCDAGRAYLKGHEERFAAHDREFKEVKTAMKSLDGRVWLLLVTNLTILGGVVAIYLKG